MDDDAVKPASAPDRFDGQGPLASAVLEDRLIDHGQLSAIAKGSGVTEAELARDFRRVNDRDVAMLRIAAAETDFSRIAHFAHRIRGAGMMLGAARLGRACRRLEAASRDGDLAQTRQALDVFETEIGCLYDYLDALSTGGAPVAGSPPTPDPSPDQGAP